jgi:hypothetical protein
LLEIEAYQHGQEQSEVVNEGKIGCFQHLIVLMFPEYMTKSQALEDRIRKEDHMTR